MDTRELERYFKPIYYVEYAEQETGMLFCNTFRMGYYDKRTNKADALRAFSERSNAVRVIEKSMKTGAEKVIKAR